MGELLESVESMKPLRRGDVVEGIVMRSDPDGVLLNIGHKAEAIVPPGEMRSLGPDGLEQLKVGDEIVASVIRGETAEGAAILSIDRALGEQGWRSLEKALESNEQVDGKILGFNRGGAIVEAEGVQGFVPMSQLVSVSRDSIRAAMAAQEQAASEGEDSGTSEGEDDATSEGEDDTTSEGEDDATSEGEDDATPEGEDDTTSEGEDGGASEGEDGGASEGEDGGTQAANELESDSYIGKDLRLKVLEVNRGRNRAILSERQVVQEQREQRKALLIQELSVGEVRRGKVTGLSNFGAFVDLGGADGLIHISELSWDTIGSPDEVLSVGDEIDVYVLRVDAENKKIGLSLKRLQQEPWETINERYQIGDLVDATVTKVTDFGAFARVEGSVEGLIHISELTPRVINHPRDVVKEGDKVKLRVLRIEPERRRMGLSLKEASEEE